MKNDDQCRLLQFINEVSFAVDDCVLYLDTHPTDENALEYYRDYSALRKEALEEYAKAYEPLLVEHNYCKNEWTWATTPWPWTGGC